MLKKIWQPREMFDVIISLVIIKKNLKYLFNIQNNKVLLSYNLFYAKKCCLVLNFKLMISKEITNIAKQDQHCIVPYSINT